MADNSENGSTGCLLVIVIFMLFMVALGVDAIGKHTKEMVEMQREAAKHSAEENSKP